MDDFLNAEIFETLLDALREETGQKVEWGTKVRKFDRSCKTSFLLESRRNNQ